MVSRLADVEQTLDLPPGYTLVALRELGDAFAHGCEIAANQARERWSGCGATTWSNSPWCSNPTKPLASARRAFFAGMNARGATRYRRIARRSGRSVSTGPTRSGSTAGLLGGARLGWPGDCAEDEVPAWLVFGVILRAADMAHIEEVQAASGVAMLSEGFEMIDTDAIIESFARHLMTGVRPMAGTRVRGDRPGLSGAACRRQGRRAQRASTSMAICWCAPPPASGPPERTSLVDALARADWYDRQARGPKLG